MRVTAALLCLVATVSSAQQSAGSSPPSEEFLTPPPITSAPRDEAPPPVPASPEEEFLPMPSAAPEPRAEPPPPPRAEPPPPPARAAPAPAPAEPVWNPPPRSTGPAESPSQRAHRYSHYSAGSGGSMLILTEALTGLVTGAMLGSAFDVAQQKESSDGYTGAVLGGLSLGAASAIYQYFIPVGRRESWLAAGAATTGLMASLAIANSRDLDSRDRAMLTFTSTQAGILSVIFLTAGGEDVSAGDAALVGMGSVYGFLVTGLIEHIHARQTGQRFNFVPMLVAPALGMAVGGLLALPMELPSSSVAEITTVPLGAGLLALLVGARLTDDDVLVAKATLGTMAGTFVLVTLASIMSGDPANPPEQVAASSSSTVQAMPVPVVLAAGRDNRSLAAGPGLFLRF